MHAICASACVTLVRKVQEEGGVRGRPLEEEDFAKGLTYLIVEEVYGMLVQPERERLQEGDVVSHDLLVREVELVHDDRVHVVVGEEVVCGRRWE